MTQLVLIGDSICKRLYYKYPKSFSELSVKFCVSGATVRFKLVRNNHEMLKNHEIFLMVGTNDIIQGSLLPQICSELKVLIHYLLTTCLKLYISTLLPTPRFSKNYNLTWLLNAYNDCIMSFQNSNCYVVRCHESFPKILRYPVFSVLPILW